jgi:hypothetical protein
MKHVIVAFLLCLRSLSGSDADIALASSATSQWGSSSIRFRNGVIQ